ncbi:N-carbamoylputrescine amidase [Rhizobium sp. KAs_5_22]|uniref:N-carbamoylputrescine amidase n=1 Tax=Ciceribacter selenitireducens TaxID=448181 RepID=UPI00048F1EED|nr:N-carbamoylputrescine amidase [Ciceribacter selenitireducens]PPJ47733.1 N-carbamoylputrescine amidase [Rhizobium sp. KAs_5_22]
MRTVTVAATQMACTWDIPGNIARAENLIRKAAAKGAQIVLIQELFEAPYFCQDQIGEFFDMAKPFEDNPLIGHFSRLAAELNVVLPVSFFEKAGQTYFNSVAIVDADGTVLGLYRKSHIPDGPGYTEKYYFSPGDTGFRVWQTKHAVIGVGICWDQWFPEAARAMALQGAELLFYPTAIGSEPQDPTIDSAAHWQRVMQGHAAANIMPVIASNRIGMEQGRKGTELTFYGSSFIADQTGNKVAEADRASEAVLTATFDLDGIARQRSNWGLFRDRRPELYTPLLTMDGRV